MTDTEIVDFIARNEAWVTFARASEGTDMAWRCWITARHFSSPDIRERSERQGFAKTFREAVEKASQ